MDVFGEIHHFMDINTITTNLANYPDDDHYYPHIASLVANKLSGTKHKDLPEDFGIILNKNNIDKYLDDLRKKLTIYHKERSLHYGEK